MRGRGGIPGGRATDVVLGRTRAQRTDRRRDPGAGGRRRATGVVRTWGIEQWGVVGDVGSRRRGPAGLRAEPEVVAAIRRRGRATRVRGLVRRWAARCARTRSRASRCDLVRWTRVASLGGS